MEKYVSNNFRFEKKEQIEYIHTRNNFGKNISINKKVLESCQSMEVFSNTDVKYTICKSHHLNYFK